MRIEYSTAIVFAVAIIVSLLIVFFTNKEHRKEMRDTLNDVSNKWAAALAAQERLQGKEVEALNRYIVSLQDIILEKDERIKQLEADAALKNFVMSCARVDGSIDINKLKNGLQQRSQSKWMSFMLSLLSF